MSRRAVPVVLARGGTSRGVVVVGAAVAPFGAERDALARALIAGSGSLTDGLGGGSVVTNKVVLVAGSVHPDVHLEYLVGNLDATGAGIDWSGTCGNMTAAVVPAAVAAGVDLGAAVAERVRLRNLATGGLVDVSPAAGTQLADVGAQVRVTTTYHRPGGAVLGATLPTGRGQDVLHLDGRETVPFTLVDVTHPYLLLPAKEALAGGSVEDSDVLERLERIRTTVAVRVGIAGDTGAGHVSATVPRTLLVHPAPSWGADVSITALSMGRPVTTVPVTAAFALAVARLLPGTVVGTSNDGTITVAGPAARVRVSASLDEHGQVATVSAERTARCLLYGTAWV